jgi:hypothetical protein
MGIKVYLCEKIEYQFAHHTETDSTGKTVLKEGFNWIKLSCDGGTFSQDTKDSDSGTYSNDKLEITSNEGTLSSISIINYQFIFRLYFSDGSMFIWGTTYNSVLCNNIKGIPANRQINFDRKSTELFG